MSQRGYARRRGRRLRFWEGLSRHTERDKAGQGGMGTDEAVKEEEHGNGIVGGSKFHKPPKWERPIGCPWAVQMEAGDKTGFAVQSETEAVFLTLYLPYASTGVPLVNAEIGRRNALYRNLLGQRRTSC